MGIEVAGNYVTLCPGPWDPHTHPRPMDAVTQDAFVLVNGGYEGKAGLDLYTRAMLKSGFTGGGIMPNEMLRFYAPWLTGEEQTLIEPWPISELNRAKAMLNSVEQNSVIPMVAYGGIDPKKIFLDDEREHILLDVAESYFIETKDHLVALKLWGAESTGDFHIQPRFIAPLVERYHKHNPEKPTILHIEGDNVAEVLSDISKLENGKNIPIHIAHVSSEIELQAVLDAKDVGMNVTCEVTIHHLFLDNSVPGKIGGYGCMKPELKSQNDIDFLWKHIDRIDMFASDCAPHRVSDKESDKPAFGVTNHTIMLPLLLGAVAQGRLTYDQLYDKLCVQPRKRFGIPLDDGSEVKVYVPASNGPIDSIAAAKEYEKNIKPGYGQNIFTKAAIAAPMIGHVVAARAGKSTLEHMQASRTHGLSTRALAAIIASKR